MNHTENVDVMANTEAILQFPKNDEQAQIIANTSDALCCYSGTDCVIGSDATTFERTAKVIDLTCRHIIKMIKEAPGHSDESLIKARNVQDSLKDIHRAYRTSLGDDNQGVTLLQISIGLFDELFVQTHLEGSSTGLTNSWVVMEMPQTQNTTSSTSTGWWPSSGVIPGLVNSYNTAKQYIIGAVYPHQYTPSSDPIALAGQQRVANSGRQLANSDAYKYIEGLCKIVPFNTIHSLYIGNATNAKTHQDIETILTGEHYFQSKDLPIVIPVGFEYNGYLERNHIALILIKDNCVEYYDAKGTSSCENLLPQNSGTFRDVLVSCQHHFTKNGSIYENNRKDQTDINSCVVFVCYHLYSRLVENSPIGKFDLPGPSPQRIAAFRENIIEIAYPPTEKEEAVVDTDVLSFSFNDFETK